MSEQSFERRARAWLDQGPTRAPSEAVASVLAAIETVPQERPRLRVAGRATPAPRWAVLAAAAAVAIAVAAGAILIRGQQANVATTPTPREPGDLLFDVPAATTVLERSGGPAATDERMELGELPEGKAFVMAGSCTGGGVLVLGAHYPEPAPESEPFARLDVPCDGTATRMNFGEMFIPVGQRYRMIADVPASATWRVAVGEYAAFSGEPSFPSVETTEGFYLLMDAPTMLTTGSPGPGIGIQVPDGATQIGVIVQCSGDPIALRSEGHDTVEIACDDIAGTTRVEYPAEGQGFDVRADTSGVAWVHIVTEANGEISGVRPTAPPISPEVAAAGYSDSDNQYVAFGTIGSNEQTLINLPGAHPGVVGGDLVAIATPNDGGGARLDLWSISTAQVVRTLAEVRAPANIYESWVDATNGQVYYGIFNLDFSQEWHRVGVDGSGDRTIVETASPLLVDAALAVDDSVFVVDACEDEVGSCARTVVELASGATREIPLDGERTCEVVGVVDGHVVARSGSTCADGNPTAMTVMALDGGPRRVVADDAITGIIVRSTAGPRLLYANVLGDVRTAYSIVDLAGGAPRELVSIDHEMGMTPQLSSVRLPAGDWVLLATSLADSPNNQSTGRPVPRLLNVVTGEQVELVNLPHSGE